MLEEMDHIPGYSSTSEPVDKLELDKLENKLQSNNINVTEDSYSNSAVNTTQTTSTAPSSLSLEVSKAASLGSGNLTNPSADSMDCDQEETPGSQEVSHSEPSNKPP